ncbi:DHA1 family purine ribonucleoside efflux pump-like MFS transporter [Trinickia symbiotica]|uniref:MFS transporter n=1 Tax=Trinickia symbiotica TaxID=863227 RepID=A0A2N7WT95_9BURK|nr:MFS transporter [Trinickia symbiotica]PMS32630.1 MFS transporter [Trinickia symbiotica]PPK41007.1 DHA1 family purine ribonucleoside efflux pump-like MFS transporter [Trinickia symbiotica]
MSDSLRADTENAPPRTAWSAVFSVALGVAALITAELLPVSLLTPMARGLHISEGMAGQSVTAVAVSAILSSLFITTIARGIDRRLIVLAFSSILVLSNALVSWAPDYRILLAARVLLGFAVGGFWAMSAALALRLARPSEVPKVLSIIFGGVSVSMVVAAPAGSLLETAVGWRGVFIAAAVLGAICLAWQYFALPSMPAPRRNGTVARVIALLGRPEVCAAMVAMTAVFAGQFSMFTFIRPLLEVRAGFDATGVSIALLVFGVANFVGTSLSAALLKMGLKLTLGLAPLMIACAALFLLRIADNHPMAIAIAGWWGFWLGCVPVAWSTWITRQLGDDVENAGGLQVALIQVANAFGAAAGSWGYDAVGIKGPVMVGAGWLLCASVLIAVRLNGQAKTAKALVTEI